MSPSSASSVAGVSEEIVVEWFNWLREECAKKLTRLEADGQLIGGPGRTVEIRLSIIVKKQKRKEEQWAFGMYERERKIGFIELVDNRSADTLVEIMERLVQPGTIVYSDPDEAFNTLGLMGYEHSVVSRKRALDTAADTVPELHTNGVLSFMSCAKKAIKADENHTPLKLILQEFMWRKRYGPLSEAFNNIIEQIAASYWPHHRN